MKHRPLHIVTFIDTRPGHVKQTRGVINALLDCTEISVTEVLVPIPGSWEQARQWEAWFFSSGKMPGQCLELKQAPDLILGTGTHTHIPMLLYKKTCGAPVITCMTPSSLLIKKFDLCIVPAHDNPGHADNIFITMGPPNTSRPDGAHDKSKGLILVGGIDKKTHHWDCGGVLEELNTIIKKSGPDIHWTVSSSFRTPSDMIPGLLQIQEDFPNALFFKAKDTGPGWIEEKYGESDICWVTGDSVSMIYEALSAGCRVGVIEVDWKNNNGKLARGVAELVDKEMILLFDAWVNDKKTWGERAVLDEAGRAAREILRKWWPSRLP